MGSFQKTVLPILFLEKCFVVLKSVSGGVTSENCLVIIFLIRCLKEKRVSKKFTKHSGVSPSLLLVLKASQEYCFGYQVCWLVRLARINLDLVKEFLFVFE